MNTLFGNPSSTVDRFKMEYDIDISEEFVACADKQLTNLFELKTGLKFSKNLCISWVGKDIFIYDKGEISKLSFYLYVNDNWNKIFILWKSKSGRIYLLNDKDIDCDDIEFSFEHLDIDLYQKQLYPNDKFPFKLKNLSFDLFIHRLNIDCTITMFLKPNAISNKELIIKNLDDFIDNYNNESERKDRKYGVVHNFKSFIESEETIKYEIDLGSAGFTFCKKALMAMSKMNYFSKIEFD